MANATKKIWTPPQLAIIANDPLQAKNNPAIRESTGDYVTLPSIGHKSIVNDAGTRVFVISQNGNQIAHKSDLVS